MARKKKTAAPQHVEPEDESQEAPDPEAQGEVGPGGKPISKAEAVRRAMAAGMDSPEDGVGFIKDRFGLEISRQHFSSTRSQIKSKDAAGRAAAPEGKPMQEASQAVEGYLAPPPDQQPAGDGPDLLAALEAMKPLVESLGAEKVKRIVDLLG